MEAQEAVDKLRVMVKVLGTFKTQYFDYKQLTVAETPDNPWRFQNSALFLRLDAFLERCHDMLDVQQTFLQVTIKCSLDMLQGHAAKYFDFYWSIYECTSVFGVDFERHSDMLAHGCPFFQHLCHAKELWTSHCSNDMPSGQV